MSNEFYIRRLQVGCSGRCVQLHRPCRSCQNCRDRKALASVPLRTLASLAMRATQGNLRVSLPYLDELPTATFSIPAHPIASLLRDSPIHVNRLRVISLTPPIFLDFLIQIPPTSINCIFNCIFVIRCSLDCYEIASKI